MVVKDIEEKVKVNTLFELLNLPINSLVEINGNEELKISHPSKTHVITLGIKGDYACINHYDILLASLTPTYRGEFSKETLDGRKYLNILIERGNKR